MFLTIEQITSSLTRLASLHPFFGMSFLAFKGADIPIASTRELIFSQIAERVLERHYRASDTYKGFYNPFHTSDKANRWTSPRYGSASLQRITVDTFSDALIHTKKTAEWGWKADYVQTLASHLSPARIPAFDLAVWLFRNEPWPESVSPESVTQRLFES